MSHIVYLLYSPSLDKYYIGKTDDIKRRFTEHERGQNKSTRKGVPWKLIGFVKCDNNSEATRLEIRLKKSKNTKYIKWFIEKNNIGSVDQLG